MLRDFPEFLPPGALLRASDAAPVIDFDPVPRLRRRRGGWSEDTQRSFIDALVKCGSIAAAARSVGMTPRSAYRLCDAPGAESFVRAWDQALDIGLSMVRADTLDRCLNGDYVPVYRRGKLARVEHRRSDRLAFAVLGGRAASADHLRRTALSRREHRLDLAALDDARAAHRAAIAAADGALKAEVDRLVRTIDDRCRAGAEPRVRTL